ncbi:MAG: hypothetical protein Q7J47_03225 [Azoarcus sp.]|nr:hypothetical protein [Azoarcus sp.]
MPRIVILSAPQATGKTRHARQLAVALRCNMIVDDYDGTQRLYPGTLALTNANPDDIDTPTGAEIIRAHDAADIERIARGAA